MAGRVKTVARVVSVASGTLAVGVAVNQILNGGVWNWWALAAASALAVGAETANHYWSRTDTIHPDPTPGPAAHSPLVAASGVRAIAVGGDNTGIISTGTGAAITQNLQTVLPPPTPIGRVDASGGLINLPPTTGEFVGRAEVLAELERVVGGEGQAEVIAVYGLGGIGKSTLAARYSAVNADQFHPIWWITADTPTGLEAGLAALATALQPEESQGLELEVLAERAVAWLSSHPGWLLVLDNVTDPAHLEALLGRVRSGRIVVTSRLAEGWYRLGARLLHLGVLTDDEAIDLLERLAQPADLDQWPGAVELVAELGCLPLAIDQAGAYLHQTRLTPDRYLDLLRHQPDVYYDRTAQGSDSERTIARIWRVTLARLSEQSSSPGDLLRTLAWMASEAIPRTLVTSTAPGETTDALGLLAAYSMITLTGQAITVHRLVQAVARTPDPDDPHRQADAIAAGRDAASSLLAQAQPASTNLPADWPAWRALIPHITALADYADPATDTPTTNELLDDAAVFLEGQGAVAQAISYFERVLTVRELHLGGEDLNTLASRNNLANAYASAGDLGRASSVLEQAVTDLERVLGSDHPQTLTSRNNLAYSYRAAGDMSRALPQYEQVLADRERVLGLDHPQTQVSRNNLATAYEAAGDLGRAIPLHEQTLTTCARMLGTDHPQTLTFRSNVANAYGSAGDLGRAIPLHEQTLADRERVLGRDHPDTLTSRNNLATASYMAGDLGRAIPLHEQTLADRERVLGGDHPDTLLSCGNLAGAYYAAGGVGRAIPMLEQTLLSCERVLGSDHPTTQMVRGNLEAIRFRENGASG